MVLAGAVVVTLLMTGVVSLGLVVAVVVIGGMMAAMVWSVSPPKP